MAESACNELLDPTPACTPLFLHRTLFIQSLRFHCRAQFSRGLNHRLDIRVFVLGFRIGFQRMAATLFLSAAPAYSRPKISPSVLSEQNILGFPKSLQISRLRDYHTIARSHAARLPYHRKYDDEDVFCNGRASVYKEFAEYLNRVWMQRTMANKYYRKAMEIEPCNHRLVREYADFVWDELGDLKKAEEVYEQALQECPVDVDLVGGFAGFLWETEK